MQGPGPSLIFFAYNSVWPSKHSVSICQLMWNKIVKFVACMAPVKLQVLLAKSCPTPCNPMTCSMPGFPVHHRLPEFAHSWPLSQWCHPTISSSVALFYPYPQSFPASASFPVSWLFASGGQSIWASTFSISPSIECSGLITFKMDWFDLLAVQGTLKSLVQGLRVERWHQLNFVTAVSDL